MKKSTDDKQIEIVINGTEKNTIDISKLLKNVSLFDFYTKPIVYSSEDFSEDCDYIFVGNDEIGSVNGNLRKRFSHYYNDTVKPHFVNKDLYTKKSCKSTSHILSQENWFRHQTEIVELSPGIIVPRFVKDIIPPGQKTYEWFSIKDRLESIEEKCWIIFQNLALNSVAFFEFDPIKYKECNRYWIEEKSYLKNKRPEISFIEYKYDCSLNTIEIKDLWINGKRTTEEEAFKLKAEYEVKKLDTLTETFSSKFMSEIYSKLSMLAKDNFEAKLISTNQFDKITYIASSNTWELALQAQNIFINHNSSEEDIKTFIDTANQYYIKKWASKFLVENNLTYAMDITSTTNKIQLQIPVQEKNKMTKTKDKVIQIAISDGQEVAKRVAAKQIAKLMQDVLIKALTKDMKGKKKLETKTTLEEFFASEKGLILIQMFCGIGFPIAKKYIPVQYHDKLTMISDEMRVQGETTIALELIGAVEPIIKMAASGIMNSLNQFSSVEELVRIETNTNNQKETEKEAEVVELLSAKEKGNKA
jgi:hypothetical protein